MAMADAPSPALALSVASASKSFDGGASFAVRDVSFDIAHGEFVALIGGSGSGKTTLLKLLNRLIEPDSGVIEIDNQRAAATPGHVLRRRIGYVFQDVGLFPHLNVAENVAITPRLLNWSEADIAARTAELLDLVELPAAEYAGRAPASLSGGQRQRVGLARALAARPQLVLMDEPFGALDALTRGALTESYARLHAALGLTTILVTHDMTEALLLADRIGVMRQGSMIALGAPDALLSGAADPYVRELFAAPRAQAARIAEKFGDIGHG